MKNVSKLIQFFKKTQLALLALVLISSACTSETEDTSSNTGTTTPVTTTPGTTTPGSTTKAPDFNLNSLDNGQVKLSNYSGKVVVLFFFGNTCPSCKGAAPSIETTLAKAYASNTKYAILGLDQWDGNTSAVQSFKTSTGVTFPLLFNASPVASSYKTTYDRLVVIDKLGNIAFSGTRGAAADVDTVKAKVDELLK